jgi:hypothetical protein
MAVADHEDRKKGWLISATSRLTAAGRARRRFNCAKQDEWDDRANSAVGLLTENRGIWEGATGRPVQIADFGAGNERLRSLLDAGLAVEHSYHPFDLHPQKPTTSRLDVAAGLPAREFDVSICLGLLEYLPSIGPLAISLHDVCRFALVSYVASDSPIGLDRRAREGHNWTNHATEGELKDKFEAAGFRPVASTRSDNDATLISLWAQ